MLSYDFLATPKTTEEMLAELLSRLQTSGFTVTSWQDGDPVLTLLTAISRERRAIHGDDCGYSESSSRCHGHW